jgi:hypothetical protein
MQARSPAELAQLLRALADLLVHLFDAQPLTQGGPAEPAPGNFQQQSPDKPQAPQPRKLREIEANIIEAATKEWVTAAILAQRAGYACNSYFRGAVTVLVDAGDLERAGRLLRRGSGPGSAAIP